MSSTQPILALVAKLTTLVGAPLATAILGGSSHCLAWARAHGPGEGARVQGRLAVKAAELPRAEVGAHAGWRSKPTPPLYDLALGRYREGDTPAAVDLLVLLLERDPESPPALLMLGGMYFRLRRYADAVYVFERFLAHAPDEVHRTRHLGHALHSLGRHADAVAHYDRVIAACAGRTDVSGEARALTLRGRGLALHRLGALEPARRSLAGAVELDATDAEAWLALARVDEELGALDAALAAANRARALAPFDPAPPFLLAALHDERGDEEAADGARAEFARLAPIAAELDDLELRLLHQPRDLGALEALARGALRLGDRARAVQTLRRIGPETLLGAALTLELMGDVEPTLAEGALRRLTTAYADDPRAHDALASHFARIGDDARRAEAAARAAALRVPK